MMKLRIEILLLSFLPTFLFIGYVALVPVVFWQVIEFTVAMTVLLLGISICTAWILNRNLAIPLLKMRKQMDNRLNSTESLSGTLPKRIQSGQNRTEAENRHTLINQVNASIPNGNALQHRYRVLVADDSPPNLQILVHQLESMGHQVTTATNGREAVALCTEVDFDLVIMDIRMPEMTGIEATRKIRNMAIYQPKIIGLTAYASVIEQSECYSAGLNEVMVKPLQIGTIKELTQIPKYHAKPPQPASKIIDETLFDLELSLLAANNRPYLADELFTLLISGLQAEQETINKAYADGDHEQLGNAVHKLMGSVRFCGVPRLEQAVEKAVYMTRIGSEEDVRRSLSVLDDEVHSLILWSLENPDPFDISSG